MENGWDKNDNEFEFDHEKVKDHDEDSFFNNFWIYKHFHMILEEHLQLSLPSIYQLGLSRPHNPLCNRLIRSTTQDLEQFLHDQHVHLQFFTVDLRVALAIV